MDMQFFRDKKILVTGHTGFKGSWISRILINAGAKLTGYALNPPTDPNLFSMCGIENQMNSIIGDIRDFEHLIRVFDEIQPEIVIHMAAQPLVRDSYEKPRYTYETNIMGTVNVCEAIRLNKSVKSFLNVTTDKVYENKEWAWGYRENDSLDGHDPYSNSKSCSELVTHSYKKSFFNDRDIAVSTARAGNVIGGGDFSKDRIIPDCVRAAISKEDIIIRNPIATRPFQHVLEPIMAYLLIVKKQYESKQYQGYYNIGPNDESCISAGEITELFIKYWNDEDITWINKYDGGPYESKFLKLDCSNIKSVFGWSPTWTIEKTIEMTVRWYKKYTNKNNIMEEMDEEIRIFMETDA